MADWANTDASLPDKKTQSALPEEQNDNLDSVAKSEESKEILVGETCEMKDLYASGKSICKCCISWEDKKPWNDNSTQARKVRDERDAFAIIRRQFPYESDMWETASIDINSAHIKLALSKVLEGYLNVKPKAPSLSFDRPFTPFCHRWERLVEVQENERDPKIREHLSLLRQTLEAELKESFCAMKDFQDTGYVTFERLPLFFVPGEVVLKSADGLVSAGVLRDVTKSETRSGKKYFEFKVMVVDWDGRKCGVLLQDWDLYEFQGPRLLRTLKISLLKIQPDHLTIQSNLVERGKKFEELRGQHIKFYKGLVPDDDDWLFYTSGTRPVSSLLYTTQRHSKRSFLLTLLDVRANSRRPSWLLQSPRRHSPKFVATI